MYKYLLFDADNTLLNFNAGERCALREVLTGFPLGFSEEVYETYHSINDNLWKELEKGNVSRERLRAKRFEKLFDKYGFDGRKFGKNIDSAFLTAMTRQSQLIEGAIDVIQKLSQKYKLYLITNASVAVQRKRLAQTPFDNYFEKYYISEEVGFHKPQKAFFDAVIDSISDADRKNYLVIGDSLSSDIKGASDSALDSCYYDPEYKGYSDVVPTYTVHRLCELLTLL